MNTSIVVISTEQLSELIAQSIRQELSSTARPTAPSNKPLNVEEAANYLGLPKQTLYQLTSVREIPHKKLGKRLVFITSELDEWVASKQKKTRKQIENEGLPTKKGGRY
jgi:excisionase family DNA binding protein